MNKILIVLIIIFTFGCKSEQKNNLNELESDKNLAKLNIKKNKPALLLDTLVFDENMDRELLAEKNATGLTELKFYNQFISKNNINKKQMLTEEHSKTEITYLGKLLDLDKQNSYHVITNFKIIEIGEMLSPRGISNIAFLSDDLDKIIIYRMNMPDELPEKIEDNILYFTLESEKVGISILGGLPPMLCLPKIGCYWVKLQKQHPHLPPYLVSIRNVKRLNYNIRVRGFRSFENQEFTVVNDWFLKWE